MFRNFVKNLQKTRPINNFSYSKQVGKINSGHGVTLQCTKLTTAVNSNSIISKENLSTHDLPYLSRLNKGHAILNTSKRKFSVFSSIWEFITTSELIGNITHLFSTVPTALTVLEVYQRILDRQASGKWKKLPQYLINTLKPHYADIDLASIEYAEDINTLHGNHITFENKIYFLKKMDFEESTRDLEKLLHELQHVVQYYKNGGKVRFFLKYFADSTSTIIKKGSFDPHDSMVLEKEADEKAHKLIFEQDIRRIIRINRVAGFEDRFRAVNDYAVSNHYKAAFPSFHETTELKYGTFFFKPNFVDWQDVSVVALGNPQTMEDRFRALNDYAIKLGYGAAFPNFHEKGDGQNKTYGAFFLKRDFVERRDVPVTKLGSPNTFEARFRAASDYSVKEGFKAAFPNFHEKNELRYGAYLLKSSVVEHKNIPSFELQNTDTFEGLFRAVNDYALRNGFKAAFPNFHTTGEGQNKGYSTFLLKSDKIIHQDILAKTLGNPSTIEERFKAVNAYAVSKRFKAAFPNFHQEDYGSGIVYGTFLLGDNLVEWRDIPATVLGNPITPADRFREMHNYAVNNGFAAAFPNFYEADLFYGMVLLKNAVVEWQNISTTALGNPQNPADRFRAVNDYAVRNHFKAAFPNFHEINEVRYNIFFLKTNAGEWQDVPAITLGSPQTSEERFRAVNDNATSNHFKAAFPNFHENALKYGTFFLKSNVVEWQNIPAVILGNSQNPADRFRAVNNYALNNGFRAAFPSFHELGLVYGTFFLKSDVVEGKDIPAILLGNPQTPEALFRALNDYAVNNGFKAAFPNFHKQDYGNGLMYGAFLLKSNVVEWQNVPASALGNPRTFEERFRAVNNYAVNNGFRAAFPNFHEANAGNTKVYGTFFLKDSIVEWRDISAAELGNPKTPEERFRAVNNLAIGLGFRAAFPNFYEKDELKYGTYLFKDPIVEFQDIPATALGNPHTFEERFRAVNNIALRKGFRAAFPTFHEKDSPTGKVYGTLFLKSDVVTWQDVSAVELGNPKTIEERFRAINDYAFRNGFAAAFPNFHEVGPSYGVFFMKDRSIGAQDIPTSVLGNPKTKEERFRAVNDFAIKNGFKAAFPNFHEKDSGQNKVFGTLLLNDSSIESQQSILAQDLAKPYKEDLVP